MSKHFAVCSKLNTNLYMCNKCKFGLDYSKTCQIQQHQEHKKYCSAITALEQIEQDRKFNKTNLVERSTYPPE